MCQKITKTGTQKSLGNFLMIILCFMLISCSGNSIVGTYQFSQINENMSVVGQQTFNENGSFSTNATLTGEKDKYTKLKFKISFSGSYSVDKNVLSQIIDINSIEVVPADDYWSKQYSDQMLEFFQQSFASSDKKDEIVELSKEQLILKSGKGENTVYKRLR
jgi:hypothetical protein